MSFLSCRGSPWPLPSIISLIRRGGVFNLNGLMLDDLALAQGLNNLGGRDYAKPRTHPPYSDIDYPTISSLLDIDLPFGSNLSNKSQSPSPSLTCNNQARQVDPKMWQREYEYLCAIQMAESELVQMNTEERIEGQDISLARLGYTCGDNSSLRYIRLPISVEYSSSY